MSNRLQMIGPETVLSGPLHDGAAVPRSDLPSSLRKGETSPARLEGIHRGAWGRYVAAWMLASTLILWTAAAGSCFFYFATAKRNAIAFEGRPTLHESVRDWVSKDIRPDYDQLNLFLAATLGPLFEFGPDGAEFRPFVKGMVGPQILADADSYLSNQLAAVRERHLRQFLRLRRVDPAKIVVDADSRRVSVPISGEFILLGEHDTAPSATHIAYEGRAILSPNVPSSVNPFSFYLEALETSMGAPNAK